MRPCSPTRAARRRQTTMRPRRGGRPHAAAAATAPPSCNHYTTAWPACLLLALAEQFYDVLGAKLAIGMSGAE